MLQERGEITLQQNHFQIFLLVAGQLYNRLCQIPLDIFLRYGTSVSIFFFIGVLSAMKFMLASIPSL